MNGHIKGTKPLNNEELELSVLRSLGRVTTQKTIAHELGHSVGKINYILKALAQKGLLKVENFYTNENKMQYRYLLTQAGIEEKIALTTKFIARKKEEYEILQAELDMIN
jgi:EPS-associated MarR family transcriptional regulator